MLAALGPFPDLVELEYSSHQRWTGLKVDAIVSQSFEVDFRPERYP